MRYRDLKLMCKEYKRLGFNITCENKHDTHVYLKHNDKIVGYTRMISFKCKSDEEVKNEIDNYLFGLNGDTN